MAEEMRKNEAQSVGGRSWSDPECLFGILFRRSGAHMRDYHDIAVFLLGDRQPLNQGVEDELVPNSNPV